MNDYLKMETIWIVRLEDVETNKIVQQHFFKTRKQAENMCFDLQHFEKYGYCLYIGMERI